MNTIRKLFTLMIAAAISFVPTAASADADHVSTSAPFWSFDAPLSGGTTKLVRTPQGLSATFTTTGLPAGHAVTLWLMFFDNPEACTVPYACDPSVDIGATGVNFDFHLVGGGIVNDKKTTISGYLQAGQTSTSGWAELGEPLVWPLTNPAGAQVILALHSHGPAQPGPTLVAQLSSYLGGCEVFLGVGGFAQSASDIPAEAGECSTIQMAVHMPAN